MKTKIHRKTYDLTTFYHPGGSIPMDIIDNKDSTCLFETYHPVSNRDMLVKILSKYEVTDDNTIVEQDVYDFTIFNDDFTKEVRLEVYNYFKDIAFKNNCTLIEATKLSKQRYIELFVLGSLFIINLRWWLSTNNFIYLLSTPFFYFLFVANYWHDAGHFALFTNKIIELFCFGMIYFVYSSLGWYNYHTHYHHSYTIVVNRDIDLVDYIDTYPMKQFNLLIRILCFFLYSNNPMDIELIKPKLYNIIIAGLNICMKMLYLKLFVINQLKNNLLCICKSFITPIIVYHLLLAIITQVNHIHTINFTNNPHFYKHQIITASNVKTNSYLMLIFSGGLNCQIEHHLFPSINSCHLPDIAKIVKPLCKKYNIPYNEYSSLFTALYDTISTAKKINSKTMHDFNFKIK